MTDKHSTLPHGHVYTTRHPDPKHIDFASAFEWFAAGWRMFAAQPGQWMLMALVAFLALAIITFTITPYAPTIGRFVSPILLILLMGGMLSVAQHQEHGEGARIKNLFDGVQRHTANLVLVGAFYSLMIVLLWVLWFQASNSSLLVKLSDSMIGEALQIIIDGVAILLSLVMVMTLIHAPALIMFRDCASIDAMRISLRASLHNLFAMLFFSALLGLFSVIIIPVTAGLGILVFIPVTIGALRRAYLDIFGAEPHAALTASTEDKTS